MLPLQARVYQGATAMKMYRLVWFYGISTIISYSMINPFYAPILNIYDLVGLGFMREKGREGERERERETDRQRIGTVHCLFTSTTNSKYLTLFSLGFTLWSATVLQVLFFFSSLSLSLVFWPWSGDLFVSLNLREFCVSHSPGRILVCVRTIRNYYH